MNQLSDAQIPVIDISADSEKVGDDLIAAIKRWGFVFIRGAGLSLDEQTVDDTFELVKIQPSHASDRVLRDY